MTRVPRHPFRILSSSERRRQCASFVCYLLILIPLASFICFYHLGEKSFGIPDEASHIQATQGMALSGNYLQPTIGKQRYFNKPPFKMWLSLIPVHFLGESNFSYRFLDGLLGCGTALTVYLLGFVLFRSWTVGFFATLALLGCRSYVFTHGIRGAVQDGMLMMLTTLAMLLGWLLIREFVVTSAATNSKRKKILLAIALGITVGCAVYTKTVAGYLAVMMLAVFLLVAGRLFRATIALRKEVFIAALLSVLIPATYFAPHLLYTKGAAQVMFGHEIVQRATEGLHNQHNIWFYFIRLFPDRAAIPPELLVVGLFCALYFVIRERDMRFLFLSVWALFPVAFFTSIPSRLTWYIAPSFPAMSLLVGFVIWQLTVLLRRSWSAWLEGAQGEECRLILLGLGWAYCLGAIGFNLLAVGSAVAVTHSRIALDLLVEQMRQLTPAAKVFVVDEPRYSYREQAYRNMLERRATKLNTLEELITATRDVPSGIVLTDAKNLYPLLSHLPIVQYRFIRPNEERKQWLGVIVFGTPLSLDPIRLVDRTVYFAEASFRKLYGFGEPISINKSGVRPGEGMEQAFLIDGDWPYFRLGAKMSLSGTITAPNGHLTVLVNSHPVVSDVKLGEHIGARQFLSWAVPPEVLQAGDNVIQLRVSGNHGEPTPPKSLMAYETLTVSLPRDGAPR